MCPYDGFSRGEDVSFVHMPIWLQIHKLPDGFCKEGIVEQLLKNSGQIVDMRLNCNTRGDYVIIFLHDGVLPISKRGVAK